MCPIHDQTNGLKAETAQCSTTVCTHCLVTTFLISLCGIGMKGIFSWTLRATVQALVFLHIGRVEGNIVGCMDNAFQEYNAHANVADGSACQTLHVAGCMDQFDLDYNPSATTSNPEACAGVSLHDSLVAEAESIEAMLGVKQMTNALYIEEQRSVYNTPSPHGTASALQARFGVFFCVDRSYSMLCAHATIRRTDVEPETEIYFYLDFVCMYIMEYTNKFTFRLSIDGRTPASECSVHITPGWHG